MSSLFMASLSICSPQISFLSTISKKRHLFFYCGYKDKKDTSPTDTQSHHHGASFLLKLPIYCQVSYVLPHKFRHHLLPAISSFMCFASLAKVTAVSFSGASPLCSHPPFPCCVVSVFSTGSCTCVVFLTQPSWLLTDTVKSHVLTLTPEPFQNLV